MNMPQPDLFNQEPEDDGDEPQYPEVSELVSIAREDGNEVVEIKADHGAARLYTAVDSEGQERLLVMDEHGMVHDIVAFDDQLQLPLGLIDRIKNAFLYLVGAKKHLA